MAKKHHDEYEEYEDEEDYEYDEDGEPTRGRIYKEAWAILLLALSIFCMLSLLSYRPIDQAPPLSPSESPDLDRIHAITIGTPADTSVQRGNFCGSVGEAIASTLLQGIGTSAYLLVGLLTFWGFSALLQHRLRAPLARLFGGALLVGAFATLATFIRFEYYGGWFGAWVHAQMQEQFSLPGSYLLLLSTSLIGVLLSTDWLPLTAAWKLIDHLRENDEEDEDEEEYDEEEEYEEEDEEEYEDEEEDETKRRFSFGFGPALRGVRNALADRLRVDDVEIDVEEEDEAEEEVAPAPRKRRTRRAAAATAESDAGAEDAPAQKPKRRQAAKAEAAAAQQDDTSAEAAAAAATSRKAKKAAAKSKAKPAGDGDTNGTAAAADDKPKVLGMIGGGISPKRKIKMSAKPNTEIPADMLGERTDERGFTLPPIDLLEPPVHTDPTGLDESIRKTSAILVKTLADFKVEAQVVEIDKGPVITLYEIELAAGIKVQRVVNLTDDLAMALKSPVRIVAPIPGKSTVGIEVPNAVREMVCLRDLAVSEAYRDSDHAIPFLVGKDASGLPIVEDLAAMPHLLIAGATGSGKSICINTVILSILLSRSPEDVQLIMIDPKMVELSLFKKIPHLITPVVTDMRRAPAILDWAVNKMEERYALLADVGVKNITGYNALGEEYIQERAKEMDADPETIPSHLPYIVIIVDELADLMMIASKEIEGSITRLAQKSRAVGIHIIFATQRPSVDVVTGLIKANFPARISFRVSSKVDSRTILDCIGAERLLGSGDLLYLPPRSANLVRAQGAYVSEKEIKGIVGFLKKQSEPSFNPELESLEQGAAAAGGGRSMKKKRDELFEEAVRFVIEQNRGSVSLLQRQFEIGYSRAARLIDQMAEDGIVGKYKGSKAREVLLSIDEWEAREES